MAFSAETLIGSIGFYYRETCGHCQLVDDGGELTSQLAETYQSIYTVDGFTTTDDGVKSKAFVEYDSANNRQRALFINSSEIFCLYL